MHVSQSVPGEGPRGRSKTHVILANVLLLPLPHALSPTCLKSDREQIIHAGGNARHGKDQLSILWQAFLEVHIEHSQDARPLSSPRKTRLGSSAAGYC